MQKQIKVWEAALQKPDLTDEDRARIEKHLERLRAYSALSDMSGPSSSSHHADGFKGQTLARIIKSQAVAAADGITFGEAAQRIYGKTLGQLSVKAADPITTSDA